MTRILIAVLILVPALLYAQERDRDAPAPAQVMPPVDQQIDSGDRSRDGDTYQSQVQGGNEEGTPEGMPDGALDPQRPGTFRYVPGMPQYNPARPQYRPMQWQLGIYGANSDVGVKITRVIQGSPADSAGLEVWDRIVAVDGYQVGQVGDRIFYLGAELQKRSGADGRVRMLIQNWRTGQLLNIDVRLQRWSGQTR